MQDNNPKNVDPFAIVAEAAANRKLPEPVSKKRRPTNALRPMPPPPVVMPDLFEVIKTL